MEESASALDDQLQRIDEALAVLDQLSGIELPTSIEDAKARKFEFAMDAASAGVSVTLYELSLQDVDRKRVVPLRTVLASLEGLIVSLERELLDPDAAKKGMFRSLIGWPLIIYDVAKSIAFVWRWSDGFRLRRLIVECLKRLVHIIAAVEIGKMISGCVRVAGADVLTLRSKALPQRQGKRYSRRKRARL